MSVRIEIQLEKGEASVIAHHLMLLAFSKHQEVILLEKMGQSWTNGQVRKEQQLIAKLADIFAIAEWSEEKKLAYRKEEEEDNG